LAESCAGSFGFLFHSPHNRIRWFGAASEALQWFQESRAAAKAFRASTQKLGLADVENLPFDDMTPPAFSSGRTTWCVCVFSVYVVKMLTQNPGFRVKAAIR